MSMIKIISPGLQTTVQDSGRLGYAHLGVPQSGAADRLSLAMANYCVGNPAQAAGLEITLTGPEIEFTGETCFAICGGVIMANLNGTDVICGKAYGAKSGDILKLGAITQGARSYLALAGGIDMPPFMGSRSTYLRGAFGGHEGRALKAGDELSISQSIAAPRALPANIMPRYSHMMILSLIAGPELNWLDEEAQDRLFTARFTASRETDRMGARLKADCPLDVSALPSMSSGPVRPGTLQSPPDGEPILLGVDGQTIGGYARIGQIIKADLPLMGQIRPGVQIYFRRVSGEEARQTLRQRTAFYQSLMPDFTL